MNYRAWIYLEHGRWTISARHGPPGALYLESSDPLTLASRAYAIKCRLQQNTRCIHGSL